VFNLGSDRRIEIVALAELVRDTLDSRSEIVLTPYEEAFGPGFDDLRHREPDLGRIREAIGFAPVIDLERTVRDIADDLRHRAAAGASTELGA
jgi:UDP-glucose 4-epimerase